MNMYPLIQKILFKLPPEAAHDLTLGMMQKMPGFIPQTTLPQDPITLCGITFPNRIGLAAGLDKNGTCIDAFARMGFGHIEVGTVTPRPQPGNPKPRLFRLKQHHAIINRMGFNNHGVDALVQQVKKRTSTIPIGINIGKNKTTPNEQALQDYQTALTIAAPYADYITINISSPNTPGLRDLQEHHSMKTLLTELLQTRNTLDKKPPLWVKIAPDLSNDDLKKMADMLQSVGIDGIIATNTTLQRNAVSGHPYATENGGLSGPPVREQSTHIIQLLAEQTQGALPIIGVGGISSGKDALEKIQAGASLVQIYTGFIYHGPPLVKEIATTLAGCEALKK